jgi:ribose transport system ATP-binding protein
MDGKILHMNENIILSLKHITKSFPGVQALNDVSIEFRKGEVHALVGENGAGKSTLVKIISGVYIPDSGTIIYDGRKVEFQNPREALENGISIIHQELNIANDLSIAENIYLGEEPKRKKLGGLLDRKAMENAARSVLEQIGIKLDVKELAGNLTASEQQIIEIAKIITRNSKIVIMDEPTSSLSEAEIRTLFSLIEKLKKQGVTILYISHRLNEIFSICDRVTVLRDGCLIKTENVSESNDKELVSSMVGRTITSFYDKKHHERKKEMLRVEGLTIDGLFSDISFSAYEGEILGISGLVGSKRTDVLECIFGAKKADLGKIFINGKEVNFNSPLDANNANVGFVTEDRRRTGLMLEQSVMANIVLPSIHNHKNKIGFIDEFWEKKIAHEYIEKLSIKTPSALAYTRNLSGGNQQKVILAKWLTANSKILLLDEPTRGIDVNAKSEFYKIMNQFVSNGGCIVMVSSEMPEILGVADRIIVMREGKITGELSGDEATELKLIQLASF